MKADMIQKNTFLLTQNAELQRKLEVLEGKYRTAVKSLAALHLEIKKRRAL